MVAKRKISIIELFELIKLKYNIKVITDYGQQDITEKEVRNAYLTAIKIRTLNELNNLTKEEMVDMIRSEV